MQMRTIDAESLAEYSLISYKILTEKGELNIIKTISKYYSEDEYIEKWRVSDTFSEDLLERLTEDEKAELESFIRDIETNGVIL